VGTLVVYHPFVGTSVVDNSAPLVSGPVEAWICQSSASKVTILRVFPGLAGEERDQGAKGQNKNVFHDDRGLRMS